MAITHFSGPVAQGPASTEAVSADKTITVDDNGKVFFLDNNPGKTVTLPSLAAGNAPAGTRYTFIMVTTFATDNWIIKEHGDDTNKLITIVVEGDNTAAAAAPVGGGHTFINLVATKDTEGDTIEIISDGSWWYARCIVSKDGAITLT